MFAQVEETAAPPVAEVGAGTGTFTDRVLAAGAEHVLAFEPEPEPEPACAIELERGSGSDPRVEVAGETLPAARALEGRCDLVLCQNVLEHIDAAAAAMACALRPGGTLLLLVPAHPRLYGALDRSYGHFRRDDRYRLTFNLLGMPGWWAKNRLGDGAFGAGAPRAYEALLKLWRPVEDRLRLPFGLSLIARGSRLAQ